MSEPVSDQEYDSMMSGKEIYGDAFSREEIEQWYRDEQSASFANYEGFVLRELGRILKPSGVLVLREPITAMGDWRRDRPRMTRRERGLPLDPFLAGSRQAGFTLTRFRTFDCPLVPRRGALLGIHGPYNRPVKVAIDKVVSGLFRWNLHYNPKSLWQKVSPSSVFVIA
jgi:hypothetical protein